MADEQETEIEGVPAMLASVLAAVAAAGGGTVNFSISFYPSPTEAAAIEPVDAEDREAVARPAARSSRAVDLTGHAFEAERERYRQAADNMTFGESEARPLAKFGIGSKVSTSTSSPSEIRPNLLVAHARVVAVTHHEQSEPSYLVEFGQGSPAGLAGRRRYRDESELWPRDI